MIKNAPPVVGLIFGGLLGLAGIALAQGGGGTAMRNPVFLPVSGGNVTGTIEAQDNINICFGTDSDFCMRYDSTNNRLESVAASATGGVWRWEDGGGNEMLTLSDVGSAANMTVSGALTQAGGGTSIFNGALTTFAGEFASSSTSTITLAAAATTFAVVRNQHIVDCDGGGNNIATITAGSNAFYVFEFVDANCTLVDDDTHAANTIDLTGAATNQVSADDMVILLYFNGTSWYQVAPESAN